MFIVEGEFFYTITEEGPLLQINKFLRSDQKLTPQILYQSSTRCSRRVRELGADHFLRS